MVFKQGILREEKVKFFVGNLCILVPFFVLTAIFAFKSDNISGWLLFSLLTFWPLFVAALLISVHQLEWFSVYHDRIGVRNIFGLKNTVFYENVQFVEEREIPLTSRGTYKTFYVFYDGRLSAIFTTLTSDLGLVEIMVTNLSTGEAWSDTFDSGAFMQNIMPISGTPGYYEIEYITESGDVYAGEFIIE